jgi:hypothetical protein
MRAPHRPAIASMNRAPRLLSIAAVLCALGTRSSVRASDHLDGPRVTADPQADITDVFAFTSPENPAHVVFALAVTPFASHSSTFSAQVDYVFRVRRVAAPQPLTLDATVLDVTCAFDDGAPQHVTCVTPSGSQVTVAVGDKAGGGDPQSPLRVFAGLRSDPAFLDRQGALATMATGKFSFAGHNAFAGANVLAIVVDLDPTVLVPVDAGASSSTDGGAAPSLLAVAAETVRRAR